MKRLLALAPLVLTLGCDLSAHWPEHRRPVVLLASDALEAGCKDNLLAAVDFWADHGVWYLLPPVEVASDDSRLVDPPEGVISIREHTFPPDQEHLGLASWQSYFLREIYSAEILLKDGQCSFTVAAHELGHALGLRHSQDPKNIMWEFESDALGVSEAQEKQIR